MVLAPHDWDYCQNLPLCRLAPVLACMEANKPALIDTQGTTGDPGECSHFKFATGRQCPSVYAYPFLFSWLVSVLVVVMVCLVRGLYKTGALATALCETDNRLEECLSITPATCKPSKNIHIHCIIYIISHTHTHAVSYPLISGISLSVTIRLPMPF